MTSNTLEEEHNEEEYNEEEDEDFNPDAITVEKDATSSDDSEQEQSADTRKRKKATPKTRKKQHVHDSREASADIGFENSGDEGIIKEGTKQERKRKSRKKHDAQHDELAVEEGLFVQTRSMRAATGPSTTRKSTVLAGKVTADIDEIWKRLNSGTIMPQSSKPEDEVEKRHDPEDIEMITISRTYTFAGQIHTETKIVPKSSAQAQAYLATKDQRTGAELTQTEDITAKKVQGKVGPEGQILSQPKRRISTWDPNPTGFVKGLPTVPTTTKTVTAGNALKIVNKTHLGSDAQLWHRVNPELIMKAGRAVLQPGQAPAPLSALARQMKIQRLNVVDKSKLDWAEHVDATGAREELEKAKKDKTSYLERRDFLSRVEDKAEDERARARGVVR